MKNYLTLILLLFANICFAQFYDDFSDGNYTENPRWFMTDMEATMVETDNGYGVELHPTGETEDSLLRKGSFRTANLLTDNTWWGCDIDFEVNSQSTGEIRFYISSSLPSLGEASGIYLSIDLSTRLIQFIYDKKSSTEILATSKAKLPNGIVKLSCQISRNGKNCTIQCHSNNSIILNSQFSTLNSIQTSTSTGFYLLENPNNPFNLCINSVNCGDRPTETELINTGEIIITEIMAKPNPSVALPEVEWIEIYNTTDRTLTLENCKISTPSKTGTFNDYILEPHDYAILCSFNAATEMSATTTKICIVESMPALNNTGNILTLKNRQNHTISFVEYSDNWYATEPFKADGGWSLERKDATNPLSNDSTWAPSIDPRGGTPAEANSVACSMPDQLIPRIVNVGITDEQTVQIYFNKPMQGEIIELKKSISLSGNSLKSVNWENSHRETLHLYLSEPLDSTNAIDISFSGLSCISNYIMPDTTITLALPYLPRYMDLIFNELMPYVSNDNSKFVEIFNNSDYYIDLSRLMLANRDDDNNLKSAKIFCPQSTILSPRQYVVVAPDINAINSPLGINPQSIYITATLPSMPADEGTIVLADRTGYVIDEVHYSDKWHLAQLNDLHDISLERIDPMASTQSAENWHSCANGNTAGHPNSQTVTPGNNKSSQYFWLDDSKFSPNNDGYQDQLIIHHNLPSHDYTVTINAYTRSGAFVGNIINNQLFSNQGYTLWDGTSADGATIEAGLYVLVVEASSPSNAKISQKLICIKI